MLKFLTRVLVGLAILYSGVVLVLFTQQRRLIFYAPSVYMTPESVGVRAEEIHFPAFEKAPKLTAWWIQPQKDRAVVVVFHGNASAVYSNSDIFNDLAAQGYGVLSAAYPGYPGSNGRPSEAALVSAAARQIEFLGENGISPDRIVYYGTSLGSGVAAQLSLKYPPSLLILDAPFYSMTDMVKLRVKLPGIGFFVRDGFYTRDALQEAEFPILILHGTDDVVIPIAESEKLFAELSEPKTRFVIEGGEHTNLWGLGARDIVSKAIETRSE